MFLSDVLSFIYVGLYWNNHHHLLKSAALLWLVPDRRIERATHNA